MLRTIRSYCVYAAVALLLTGCGVGTSSDGGGGGGSGGGGSSSGGLPDYTVVSESLSDCASELSSNAIDTTTTAGTCEVLVVFSASVGSTTGARMSVTGSFNATGSEILMLLLSGDENSVLDGWHVGFRHEGGTTLNAFASEPDGIQLVGNAPGIPNVATDTSHSLIGEVKIDTSTDATTLSAWVNRSASSDANLEMDTSVTTQPGSLVGLRVNDARVTSVGFSAQ